MQDSVKVLPDPADQSGGGLRGNWHRSYKASGSKSMKNPLEQQQVELGLLRSAKEKELTAMGHRRTPTTKLGFWPISPMAKTVTCSRLFRSYSPIFIAMKICFLGGLGISLPAILYFVGGFVVPGLTPERKEDLLSRAASPRPFLFLAGASMTYLFILPALPCLYDRDFHSMY